MLNVYLLGTLNFRLNGKEPSQLLTGRTSALLAYLVATRQPQSRATLANLLWNADSEQQGRSNLRYVLRDLRKAVGEYLVVNGENVACNQSLPYWVDSTTFADHIRQVSQPSQTNDPNVLQNLLNLYTGEFLAGFQLTDAPVFDEWAAAQRRYLHDLFVQGLNLRIQQQMDAGEYEAGLELNRYLLTLEPWREETHRQRMLLFAHLNQRSAALKQYSLCCQILVDELDVPPMPQTTTLYEQIKSGQWFSERASLNHTLANQVAITSFPQTDVLTNWRVREASSPPTAEARARQVNLGSMPELVRFVGREEELAILGQRIGQENYPLFAVLGLAGQGKSALAAAFVHSVCEEETGASYSFRHIIWRSLADAPSCSETLQDWLRELDPAASALSTSFDQLIARLFVLLEEQRCLLVLDGVESVMAASPKEAEAYDTLFRLFFRRRHHSCLLLTSRSRPKSLTALDERDRAFRWLELGGLPAGKSIDLLTGYGLGSDADLLGRLGQKYVGNPQLLTQAAILIHDLFGGDAHLFAEENLFFLGEIGAGLHSQLQALAPLERSLLQKLADSPISLSRQSLWESLDPCPEKSAFLVALRSLQNTFLVRRDEEQIGLPQLLAHFLQEHRL